MTQSGMMAPVEPGSEIGIFDAICADIGDEQSLEQSLSTFSSHMTRIIRVIQQATPKTLVLFDEVGAGTDPAEGAALAMSILDELLDRGALFLVTSHHGALKMYAHSHDKLQNASMEFDEETLSPTYRLLIGVPGSSHALKIARRLGMPPRVLDGALGRVGERAVEMERLITDVDRMRRELEVAQNDLKLKLAAATEKERDYNQRMTDLRSYRDEIKRKAEHQAEAVLRESKALVERTIAELRAANGVKEVATVARREIQQAHEQIKRQIDVEDLQNAPIQPGDIPALKKGDEVYFRAMRASGEVLEPPDHRGVTRVRIGEMTVTANVRDLDAPQEMPDVVSKMPKQFRQMVAEKQDHISTELDVRGQRALEALENVDKYLDDASLAGLERVYVIHGKGTGALRKALHEHLRNHPHISKYTLGKLEEGGAGVTVADLRA